MPSSIRPLSFDPGFMTRVTVGFALSIAFRTASGHGGTVRVMHGEPAGAVFIIELPAA